MSPEDRQLLQDIWKQLVATDRSLNARIDHLEARFDQRIDTIEARFAEFAKYTKAMFRHLAGQIAETNVRLDAHLEGHDKDPV